MELAEKYKTRLSKAGINTTLRLAHFFAQIHHESGLQPINESLNYSADALISKFGRHRISITDANKFGRTAKQKANQKEIANILYGGKWGRENLGNTEPGDGWKYRGRGFKQITGRANYVALSKATGIDYVGNPDLLLNEADAMISAIWFWTGRNLNKWADLDDIKTVTFLINGGYNGLDKRAALLKIYKDVFK